MAEDDPNGADHGDRTDDAEATSSSSPVPATPSQPSRSSWLSDRTGLSVLAVFSALLGLFVILPYLQYVLLGVVLAYILMPAQRQLEQYVRSMTAALVLVVVAILAIILPLAYVLAIALDEALDVVTAIQEGDLGIGAIEEHLESTGYTVDLNQLYETYQEPIATGLQGLATSGIELVTGLPGVLIGLTVTLFVLFALLRDGDALVAWFGHVLPIRDELQRELRTELDQLMWASVVGNVAVAAIQAILLGIGLAILGVPAIVFLTVTTFVLALLPLIGAFGVWVPVSIYLLATGQLVPALALVVYGSLVSASDTYLRPALIGRTSAFNSAIIVVGIFGGLIVFGAVGLFIGPVVLGGAKITLDVFARERDNGEPIPVDERAADPAVDTSDAGIETVTEDVVPTNGDDHVANGAGKRSTNADDTPNDSESEPNGTDDRRADTEPKSGTASEDEDVDDGGASSNR